MNGQLSASGLALATANDPQFRLPQRPSVVPGAVVTWIDDQLLVEGTGTRRVLSGRSARRILPDLLPLLDGRRSIGELASALGQPVPRLRAVLLLLFSCGLLQEGPAPEGDALTPQAVLLSRMLDTTRVNANGDEARQRLAAARVGIHADGAYGRALHAHLRREGIRAHLGPPAGDIEGLSLVVAWVAESSAEQTRELGRRARHCGVPVLLAGAAGDRFFIGPYSAADYGACADCCLAHSTPGGTTGFPGSADALAALTTVEIVALLGRVGTPVSLRGRALLDLRSGQSASVYIAPRPGCEQCGDPKVELQEAPLAYQYETSVAFPPRRLVNPRDHQHHFEAANVALQFETKQFPGKPVIALPDGDLAMAAGPRASEARPATLTLAHLSALLLGSCGLKERSAAPDSKRLRWAPTGGNLGSPAAYVAVRGLPGLPPGTYAYLPEEHQLARLRESLPPGLDQMPEPVAIVLTAALLRVAKKYHAFAYRIVHLDSGVALTHLLLLCRRLGLRLTNEPSWDDEGLARALGVDRELEAVAAVVRVEGDAR